MAVNQGHWTRRDLIQIGALSTLSALVGCSHQAEGSAKQPPFSPKGGGAADAPLVLAFMPQAEGVGPLWASLRAELEEEFRVEPVIVEAGGGVQAFESQLKERRPVCIVLIDNSVVRGYRDYQRQHSGLTFPPSIVLMSAFTEELTQGLRNSTGVSYEVPVATSVALLRTLVKRPINKVGVIYRDGLRAFVARQYAFAGDERFELIGVEVSKQPSIVELRKGLRHLLIEREVDALWVLNDDRLLRPEYLRDAWLPAVKKTRIPTIVGVSNLLSEKVGFGTLAIEPELSGLGHQAANMIYQLQDGNWHVPSGVEFPLSTRATIDAEHARSFFGLNEGQLEQVSVLSP